MSFFIVEILLSLTFGFPGSSIPVAPGGYAWAVYSDSLYNTDFTTVDVLAQGPFYSKVEFLPTSVTEAISLCPEWMQRDLQLRFADLIYQPVQLATPIQPLFADCNNDGFNDIVLKIGGGYKAYLFPEWVETSDINESQLQSNSDINGDGIVDSASFTQEGKLTIQAGNSLLMETEGFQLPPVRGTALLDMEGDGLVDLVVGTEGGSVLIFRNRGTATSPCFMPFYSNCYAALPMNFGAFSTPAIFLENDSLVTLALGTGQNGLAYYQAKYKGIQELDWQFVRSTSEEENVSVIAVQVDNISKLICASRNGSLFETHLNSDSMTPLDLPSVPGTYPSLALVCINSDNYPDLLSGTEEGSFYFLSGTEDGWFENSWLKIDSLPLITSAAPAGWRDGLLIGSVDGTLRYFQKNDIEEWIEVLDNNPFASIDVGEYANPAFFDFNGDDEPELILGSSTGDLICYEFDPECNLFTEVSSWGFETGRGVESLNAYYSRYFRPFSLFCIPDSTLAEIFAQQIIEAESQLRDEIAYCIANTPSDVLQAMHDNNDTDLFTVNARALYHQASLLRYVELRDSDEGTKCLLNTESGWFELTDENYYKYTVHPRILFETPARINAEFWATPCDTMTTSLREYLNVEIDSLFGSTSEHHFWRDFIPADTLHGETLESSMAEANSYEQAVLRLCNYLSFEQPNSFMSFGYMTNDLQPMVIYRKSYGSCGEQSILQTALCRTFFMPSFPVGCRGEDHQWNHCLEPQSGEWSHWDINNGLAGLGDLWVSGEGVNHEGKTISTIAAFDPDGRVRSVTDDVIIPLHSGYMDSGGGYTRTAAVDIIVTDPLGSPIEGAMILVKSHWENADAVTAFDYTDSEGFCSFELGWQVNGGYAFDIISPFGSGGTTAISFTEDSSYTLEYTLPYLKPTEQAIRIMGETSDEIPRVTATKIFYPIPYFSRSLYSIGTDTTGVICKSPWVRWREISTEENLLYMNSLNFNRYIAGYNCNASLQPINVQPGDSCFVVLDNRNSMFTWIEFSPSENLRNMATEVTFSDSSPTRQPISGISLPVASNNISEKTTNWVQYYEDLEIYQDNPDDPLSSELVIGPFKIPEGERSINFVTLSETAGLDLDLFLFMDKNSNRILDGMNELLQSSATPSGNENIFINNPNRENVYWLYLQGWQVDENGGFIDLGLSFIPEPISVHSLNPTSYVTEIPETFSFKLMNESLETVEIVLGDSKVIPQIDEHQVYSFTVNDISLLINEKVLEIYGEDNELIEELNWELLVDSVPPSLVCEAEDVNPAEMVFRAKINYSDLESGIETVSVTVDSTVTKIIDLYYCPAETIVEIDFLERSGEPIMVKISASDNAGNITEEIVNVDIPDRAEVVFSNFYPGGITYNHQPIFQALAHFAEATENWDVILTLYGDNYERELKPYILDGNLIQFFSDSYLEDGYYTATIQIFNSFGNAISECSWFFEIGTMTSTTGRNR